MLIFEFLLFYNLRYFM